MKTKMAGLMVLVVACWVMGLAGCCSMSKPININNLQEREDPQGVSLMYAPNEDKPFTGRAVLLYEDWDEDGDAQMKIEGNLKNGLVDGQWTEWYENGQKKGKGGFKDGKKQGPRVGWHENGQMMSEEEYKDGEQHGPCAAWYGNGQKMFEGAYKDGEEVGTWTWWHENGQKGAEGDFQDGEKAGTWTYWDEDGTVNRTEVF